MEYAAYEKVRYTGVLLLCIFNLKCIGYLFQKRIIVQ